VSGWLRLLSQAVAAKLKSLVAIAGDTVKPAVRAPELRTAGYRHRRSRRGWSVAQGKRTSRKARGVAMHKARARG
jgi:hypothetical protein